ncbi:hypothetical protein FHT87_003129 [Rhizobium sp. BK316]|uniref:hypothetical protein n=1 Tax=Rhizobium sp. BK316 TaxID=2587053 RepID=UPI001621130A|nr:hypothetical protein [Rhizobium sp. BK316]MBB3409210.1 hypothetical protein [Rhizobium sp. BK316]
MAIAQGLDTYDGRIEFHAAQTIRMLELFSALAADYMASIDNPLASTVPAIGTWSLRALMQKRASTARDVLLHEIRQGHAPIEFQDADEAAAITYRYMRAAEEGAARLNLRLLARVIVGSAEGPGLYADDFLRWADVLAGLRREEVIVLGVMQRVQMGETPIEDSSKNPPVAFWLACTRILEQQYGLQPAASTSCAHALLRTGLVQLVSGSMETVVVPAPTGELTTLSGLLRIEGLLASVHA